LQKKSHSSCCRNGKKGGCLVCVNNDGIGDPFVVLSGGTGGGVGLYLEGFELVEVLNPFENLSAFVLFEHSED